MRKMAQDLNTTLTLVLTHAAKEAGWRTHDLDQNQPLNRSYELIDDLWSASFRDGSTGWIVGQRQVWSIQRMAKHGSGSQNVSHSNQEFFAVDFINRQEGWIMMVRFCIPSCWCNQVLRSSKLFEAN